MNNNNEQGSAGTPQERAAVPHWIDTAQDSLGGRTAREGYAANPEYSHPVAQEGEQMDGPRLSIEKCIAQFRMYADGHTDPMAKHQLKFCADFLRDHGPLPQPTPSDSASVDTAAFRKLLNAAFAHRGVEGSKETVGNLIAHIESLIAARVAGERMDALEEAALLVETNELNSAAFNAAEIRALIHSPATSSKEGDE